MTEKITSDIPAPDLYNVAREQGGLLLVSFITVAIIKALAALVVLYTPLPSMWVAAIDEGNWWTMGVPIVWLTVLNWAWWLRNRHPWLFLGTIASTGYLLFAVESYHHGLGNMPPTTGVLLLVWMAICVAFSQWRRRKAMHRAIYLHGVDASKNVVASATTN